MANKIRPFSCGTQSADWESSNCDRCKKGAHRRPDATWPDCEIQSAIYYACFDDGTVTVEIAQRMNHHIGGGNYVWCCGEYDATEEWKAEFRLLHPEKFATEAA